MRRCQGQVFMNVAQIWTDYLKEKKIDAQVEIFCCIHYNVWVKKIYLYFLNLAVTHKMLN